MDPQLDPRSPRRTTFAKLSLRPLDNVTESQRPKALSLSKEASTSHPQDIPSSPPSESSHTTLAARPDWVAQRSFVRHLVEAGKEECQHASESVTPANLSPSVAEKGKEKEAEVREGKGYFGCRSQTSEHIVKDEPCTPVRGEGWGNGRQGPVWSHPNAEEGDDHNGGNGNQALGWGGGGNAHQGGNAWGERPATQDFDTQDGAAQKGWGNWGGGGGGWGQNMKDRKKRTRCVDSQGWGNNDCNNGGWGNDNANNDGWGTNAEDGQVFNDNNNQGWNQPEQNFGRNCNQHDHQYEQRGHVRSRLQSEATIQPFDQTQQQVPQNNAQTSRAQDLHYHQHHHTDAQHPQNQTSKEEKLIDELRAQNAKQVELITEQRIRIAVLENEAKHISKSKEDAVNASVIIAQTLSAALRGQVSPPRRAIEELRGVKLDEEFSELTRKIEVLQKANLALRMKDRESKYDAKLQELAFDEDLVQALPPSRRLVTTRRDLVGKGKEKMTSEPTGLFGAELHATTSDAMDKKRARGEGLRKAYEKDKAAAALDKSSAETFSRLAPTVERITDSEPEKKLVTGWDESFTNTDIPTVPNSPVLAPHSSFNTTTHSNTQLTNSMSDIGLQSLDEVLNDVCPRAPTLQPSDQLLGDIDTDIEALPLQIQAQMLVMQDLSKLPAPTVLKTGTNLKNSRRGAEYDYLAPQPVAHQGGMGSFNRFETSSTAYPNFNTTIYGLWSSEEGRDRAVQLHKKQAGRDVRYPDMFRYGIQYVPEEDDENYIRTVSISNLPSDITLREVLARVRGGNITKAILMDTQKLMGGTMSALVTFVEDYDAKAFVDYAAQHPITFGDDDEVQTAEIALIPTPAFPASHGMKKRISLGRNDTRCIAILNVPENFSLSKLQNDISCQNIRRAECLLEMYLDENNTLHLEFSSMPLAGSAFGILTCWQFYQGLNVIYEPDPCAGPLDELALPVPPRPPMLPRGHNPSPPYEPQNNNNSSSDSLAKRTVRFAGVDAEETGPQRRSLAALTQQKIDIPSFSGSGIKSSSWADEVIDESESSDPVCSSASQNPSYPEHDEHDELPHTHSEAPPNSPIEGVLPLDDTDVSLSPGIKEAVDMIMTADVNKLMRENPGSFRKAPVGLAGSKYATVIPGFEDRREVRNRSGRYSPPKMFMVSDGSTTELWKMSAAGREESGEGKEVESSLELKAHPELEPANLLAAALDSGSDDDSTIKAAFEERMPEPEYRHSRTPYPSPSGETIKPAAGYEIKAPTYSPTRSPEASPTPKSQYPSQHTTPLLDFNLSFEARTNPTTNPVPIPAPGNPHTPHNTSQTPPPETPQKPHQNAELYNKTVPREYYAASDEVPESEWTREDVETLKNSSPKTRERYARLMEMGREVGEFGGMEEMVPELQTGSGSRSGSGWKGKGWETESEVVMRDGQVLDPFETVDGGKGSVEKGRGGETVEAKINPDEIELDMEDDSKDADAGVQEQRPCVCRVDSEESVHSDGCSGYMSIGG